MVEDYRDVLISRLCGPQCLHFVLRSCGMEARLSSLVNVALVAATGSTYASLAQASVGLGLVPWLLTLRFDELARILELSVPPAIVVINNNHFVCCCGIHNDSVDVYDPNLGHASWASPYFQSAWDGRALFLGLR